jgi:ATP phosphoribosyltransferase regulatory subunit HisZ
VGERLRQRGQEFGATTGRPRRTGWFDAYCEGVSGAVARGGRYDEVGKAFGRARPATGFSIDLRGLASAAGQKAKRK